MSPLKALALIIIAALITTNSYSQNDTITNRDNVVIQMNYCINSMTNIIHNKSMDVLIHESDQLINNLTIDQIVGLREIKEFRLTLLDKVSKLLITEEERALTRRIQSIKRDNMKWSALSNALNPTMLMTGGGNLGPQLAFQVLLTAARTAVEYRVMQGEQEIEDLQAMWALRKNDLQDIKDVRIEALKILYTLFSKYQLNENERMTEETSVRFHEYIGISDAARRIRVFEKSRPTYRMLPEYYYHLGMAYLDNGNYEKAKLNFLTYMDMYCKNPILRYDERSGCIALARLTYEKELSVEHKEELINVVLKNLPSNSAALLQCALIYITQMSQVSMGVKLLQSGIDDPRATDTDILLMALANLIPNIPKSSTILNEVSDIFAHSPTLSFDSYLTYISYTKKYAWTEYDKVIKFSDVTQRIWRTLWLASEFTNSMKITLPEKITYNFNGTRFYSEFYSEEGLTISQLNPNLVGAISEKQINDIDCFKYNKNAKFLFVESIRPGSYFLKRNIDISSVKQGIYPGMSEFNITTDSDWDEIANFCKKYQPKDANTCLSFSEYDGDYVQQPTNSNVSIKFKGEKLAYSPHYSPLMKGHYIRIVIDNGIQILYHFNEDSGTMERFMYYCSKMYHFVNIKAKNQYFNIVEST